MFARSALRRYPANRTVSADNFSGSSGSSGLNFAAFAGVAGIIPATLVWLNLHHPQRRPSAQPMYNGMATYVHKGAATH